ncbi:MAG: hypothetical protein JO266_09890 [Acidobacteria bacterium]|nr:hypothetical protein [Acidobacteriota bacterium]MBV9482273.1 hypothetical protein [Acidobacteriota bacterium]
MNNERPRLNQDGEQSSNPNKQRNIRSAAAVFGAALGVATLIAGTTYEVVKLSKEKGQLTNDCRTMPKDTIVFQLTCPTPERKSEPKGILR